MYAGKYVRECACVCVYACTYVFVKACVYDYTNIVAYVYAYVDVHVLCTRRCTANVGALFVHMCVYCLLNL